MSALVPLILLAWIPAVILICRLLPPRTAVLFSFITAFLFLPVVNPVDPGLSHLTKMSATCVGVIIGGLLFHSGLFLRFRPKWYDLPLIIWCICPIASSVTNDLGFYNGASDAFSEGVVWVLPYLVGRIYFNGVFGLRQLATGIFIGGLVYIPFCLIEMRFSPQLHLIVYGYHQHDFGQTYRFGGWRPMVFMEHGLQLGMWMSMATLCGLFLWWTKTRRTLFGFSMGRLVAAQFLVTVGCKSTGALMLLLAGTGLLYLAWTFRWRFILATLALVAPAYLCSRITHNYYAERAIQWTEERFGADRGSSLEFRVKNEDILMQKAMQRPVYGWSGYDRSAVFDEYGSKLSVSDSLWIIILGMYGALGLTTVTFAQVLPAILYLYRNIGVPFKSRLYAPGLVLAVVVLLFSIDNLMNNMMDPIFMIAAGGLAGCRRVRIRHVHVEPAQSLLPPGRASTRLVLTDQTGDIEAGALAHA